MVGILSFLAVASAIAFVVAVLLLVVRSVKKQPRKPFAVMAAASAVAFCVLAVWVSSIYGKLQSQRMRLPNPSRTHLLPVLNPHPKPGRLHLWMIRPLKKPLHRHPLLQGRKSQRKRKSRNSLPLRMNLPRRHPLL